MKEWKRLLTVSVTFKNHWIILFLSLRSLAAIGQVDSSFTIAFDFNNHKLNETIADVKVRASDASLVEDRFGNAESAVYINGSTNSYINLN